MPSKTKPAFGAGQVDSLLAFLRGTAYPVFCRLRLLGRVWISFVDHLATIAAGNPEYKAVGADVVSGSSSKKTVSWVVTHGLVLSFGWYQLKICYAPYQCSPGGATGIGAGWRKAVRFGGELLKGGPLFGSEFQ